MEISYSGTSNFSTISHEKIPCLRRESVFGSCNEVPLATNGPLVFSYLPDFHHYCFTSAPDPNWLASYYENTWGQKGCSAVDLSFVGKIKKLLKPIKSSIFPKEPDFDSIISATSHADIMRSFHFFEQYLLRENPESQVVLDLGGGDGTFLEPYVRKNYKCYLVEPSNNSAEIAQKKQINVIHSVFSRDSAEIIDKISQANLIFCNHSIEHHFDPASLLTACHDYMKNDAVLSLTVPNGDAAFFFMAHIFPLHLDLYTEKSFSLLFEKYGFEILQKEIGPQLRYLVRKRQNIALVDGSAIAPNGLAHESFASITAEDEIRFQLDHARVMLRQFSRLANLPDGCDPKTIEFVIKGARPFAGIDYVGSSIDEVGSRAFSVKIREDGSSLISYLSSSDTSCVMLK